MSSVFTQFTGAAAEYLPAGGLSLNPYTGLCPYACAYCYANRMEKAHGHDWPLRLKDNFFTRLEQDAVKLAASSFKSRIHISFLGDIYAPGLEESTRCTLEILRANGIDWQVLSKRPSAAVKDLDLYGPGCWLGTTFTGHSWEEEGRAGGSDNPGARLGALEFAGVRTWVSVEPMVDSEALDALLTANFVAVGVERGKGTLEVAADLQARCSLWKRTGWLLKQSLRVPGLEPPFAGNLERCGWEVPARSEQQG